MFSQLVAIYKLCFCWLHFSPSTQSPIQNNAPVTAGNHLSKDESGGKFNLSQHPHKGCHVQLTICTTTLGMTMSYLTIFTYIHFRQVSLCNASCRRRIDPCSCGRLDSPLQRFPPEAFSLSPLPDIPPILFSRGNATSFLVGTFGTIRTPPRTRKEARKDDYGPAVEEIEETSCRNVAATLRII